MNTSSRSVLYELLYAGLVDIRAASGGTSPMSADNRDFVNQISNLLHNLPHRLEAAETSEACDDLLRRYAGTQRPIPSAWISSHLERLGIELDANS